MPEEKKTKAPAKPKGPVLYYSTHNITGMKPPVNAFIVLNPASHKTADGKPMIEKIQEFQERGLLIRVAGNNKVGTEITPKGKNSRNAKGSLSEGRRSGKK